MSVMVQQPVYSDEIHILASALYAWCAEHNIKATSQAGLSAASKAIDLFHAGFHSHDVLLSALHGNDLH